MNNKTFNCNSRDSLFEGVAHYVVERQVVSASAISDKFCIGYNRANRIIKQLEQTHIIGEELSSRHPREIYYCCFRRLDQKLADLATIARLQPLEDKWQAECAEYEARERDEEGEDYYFKLANHRPLTKEVRAREEARARFEAMTDEERQAEEKHIDKEWEEENKNWRNKPVHGMKREDWCIYHNVLERQKREMIIRKWPWGVDFSWSGIFDLMKFKIERMIEYLVQFGYCRDRHYVVSTMHTACRLIKIVLKDGNESGDYDKFPYRVNLRNAHRFNIYHDYKGDWFRHNGQKVRYYKAYCILFKYLEYHMHNWRD